MQMQLRMGLRHFIPPFGFGASFSCASDASNGSVRGLDDLPEEILLYVASFLTVKDVLNFSRTNKHLYRVICGNDSLWKQLILEEIKCYSSVLDRRAVILQSRSTESPYKLTYMLHKMTAKNWSRGDFTVAGHFQARANVSRPPRFLEFQPEKIGCVDVATDGGDGFHYVLHLFDVATWTAVTVAWHSDLWEDLRKKKHLTQVNNVIVEGTTAVLHFGPYKYEPVSSLVCDHAIVALDFSLPWQLDELWHKLPVLAREDWSTFHMGEDLFLLVETTGHFRVEQISLASGELLQEFHHDDLVVGNSQCVAKDDPWMAIPCINVVQWRKIDIFVINARTKTAKTLERLERPTFTVPRLSIKNGLVLTLLDDLRIPVWDPSTGKLLMVASKADAMARTLQVSKPFIIKAYDDSDPLEISIFCPSVDVHTRKVMSFVQLEGDFKLVPGRSFKFENAETILDTFVIHDLFFVVYITFMGWLKVGITPMNRTPGETKKKFRTLRLIPVREYMFGRRVHFHVTPTCAIIRTPEKIFILDFSSNKKSKKSYPGIFKDISRLWYQNLDLS